MSLSKHEPARGAEPVSVDAAGETTTALETAQRSGYSFLQLCSVWPSRGNKLHTGIREMPVRSRKDVVLVGARGLAKDIIGYLEEDGGFRIVCLLDQIAATQLLGYDVVRPEEFEGGC